ncbi:MAG: flagellar protein FlaG [Bacillota bacterium]
MRIDAAGNNPPAADYGVLAERASQPVPQAHKPLEGEGEGRSEGVGGNQEDVEEYADRLNETLRLFDRRLAFEIHEDTQRYLVRVVDPKTDEIIREIPPEEFLDLVARIEQMVGLIIDEWI